MENGINTELKVSIIDAELIHKIRPGKKPYIVFFLLFFPIACLYVFLAITKDISALQGAFISVMIILGFHAWIYSHTVELYLDRITYHYWFFKELTIPLKNIDRWSLQTGVFKYSDRFKPTVRLEIHHTLEATNKPIIIPTKLYIKEDVDKILNYLPPNKERR